MKKILVFLALSITFISNAQLIAEYTFGSTIIDQTNSASYVNYSVLSNAGPVNIGPGQSQGFAIGNPGMSRWAQYWTTNGSPDLNQHFRFILKPVLYGMVTIDSISFQERRSDAGPRTIQVRTSLDFNFVVWDQPIPDQSTWRTHTITSNLPTFSDSIDIRLYAFDNEGPDGNGAWRIDNLKIYAKIINLPIELISFTASSDINKVRLNWVTAIERDNEYFTVFRSSHPSLVDSWEEVGRVRGLGDSQTTTLYESFDPNPISGISYYKLRQTDTDGTFTESHVVPVNFTSIRRTLKVGDDAFIQGQSYLIDGLGRVIAFERVHTLKQPGYYILQGENGQVVRLHVLP